MVPPSAAGALKPLVTHDTYNDDAEKPRVGGVAVKGYDVVIIGGGPGGYVATIKAAQLGLKTACVEGRGALGGTCLNVGCIPSKSLLHNSHLYHVAHEEVSHRGIKVSVVEKSVAGLTRGVEGLFKKNKTEYVKGWGKLLDANTVAVDGLDGSKSVLTSKNIIIATGSEPSPFPGVEIDEESIVTSTGALSLKKVPEKLIVIGGGVIRLEVGSVWKRLGAECTVVECANEIGAGMDADMAKVFRKTLQKQGLEFKLGTKVVSAVKNAQGKVDVVVEPATGGPQETLTVDVNAGVQVDAKGRVVTDAEFKTNVPSVRALGDVIAGPMLAHKAEEEGVAAVEYIKHGHGHVNYNAVPSVIYTWPEVAWAGLSEAEAKAKGADAQVPPTLAEERNTHTTKEAKTGFMVTGDLLLFNGGKEKKGVLSIPENAGC
ncbi:dihydrolipoyl dehydrogenase [Zopfochytrium polystomum]|nr:dihydrolipoyl dehydrogenase [Zopfochytrium polystomum]